MKKQMKTQSPYAGIKIESGIDLTTKRPASVDSEPYKILNKMEVGQSIKIPRALKNVFNSAKVNLRRHTSKVFISRTIDKYNIRYWRITDGTILKVMNKQK